VKEKFEYHFPASHTPSPGPIVKSLLRGMGIQQPGQTQPPFCTDTGILAAMLFRVKGKIQKIIKIDQRY